MNDNLTLGSLFDGSGGFPLGGLISGITPVWASEIEPFPIRVTAKRMPFIKHYGDISTMNGGEIEPVDIITFGSPCQDMSVAGKRDGLDGSRSSLFYEAIRIVKEMRGKTNGKYPRFIVWENVPGAFSSNKGEDFRCVLESICKVKDETASIPKADKWQPSGEVMGTNYSLAWRVLDAQYWGVPQRRKRIYLVADFAGKCAGKILFESEGVSGYSKSCIGSWQGTPNCAKACTRASSICLNDQGGNRMDVTEDITCTLRAESHHPPCVLESAGFCTEHSANARGIGYEKEISPTLRAGTVPAALMFENHGQDCRYKELKNVCQTVLSTFGTGGNNQPFVVCDTPKTLKIRSGCDGGGKGALIQDDKSATLGCNNDQTVFVPKAYGICSKDSNSMKSDNPHSGIYKADTSRTIDANGGNPSCNQGGIAVVESYSLQGSMIGRKDENGPNGDGINEDISFTLNTTDKHAVVYAIDRESYNCGQNYARKMGISDDGVNSTLNAQGPSAVAVPSYSMTTGCFMQINEEKAPTLAARDYKDPPLINDVAYTVRRLTPTECARLQGFPDSWCADLHTENPTDEDIAFWSDVFETHRKIIGKSSKPKSEKQIIKWLKSPHSDSAEYKMWGNGVALPNVILVLSGIVYYSQFIEK